VKYAESQQIEAGAAVHLSLDELESVDLPFNVALTQGQLQRCFDGLLISCQEICEADQGSLLCRSKLLWESCESRFRMIRKNSQATCASVETKGEARYSSSR
jgi:hypothetical protein